MRLQKLFVSLFALMLFVTGQAQETLKCVDISTRDGRTYQLLLYHLQSIQCKKHVMTVDYTTNDSVDVDDGLIWDSETDQWVSAGTTHKELAHELLELREEEGVRISFSEIATAIDAPTESMPQTTTRIEPRGNGRFHITGMQPSDRISVFAIDGRSVAADIARSGDTADVSLSLLPRGTYIIKVNQYCTLKFLKQ